MRAFLAWTNSEDRIAALMKISCSSDYIRPGRSAPKGQIGNRRLAAYGLLRHMLTQIGQDGAEAKIRWLAGGRPVLQDGLGLTVSVSYSTIGVAAGIGIYCDVGVDIEAEHNDAFWEDISECFAPNVTGAEKRLAAWVASEACAKSHGMGLTEFLNNPVPFSPNGQKEQLILWKGLEPRSLLTCDVKGGQIALAATAGASLELREFQGTDETA